MAFIGYQNRLMKKFRLVVVRSFNVEGDPHQTIRVKKGTRKYDKNSMRNPKFLLAPFADEIPTLLEAMHIKTKCTSSRQQ